MYGKMLQKSVISLTVGWCVLCRLLHQRCWNVTSVA